MGGIRWTALARRELKAIGSYIARDNPSAARQWTERLRQRMLAAAEMPRAGRVVPERGREDLREVLLGRYRLIYLIVNDGIVVQTVFEGHRLLGSFLVDE